LPRRRARRREKAVVVTGGFIQAVAEGEPVQNVDAIKVA